LAFELSEKAEGSEHQAVAKYAEAGILTSKHKKHAAKTQEK
jgi:hypothetical protein